MLKFLSIFMLFAITAAAQTAPQFSQFPSEPIYRGPHAPADLSTRDAIAFRTRLRAAAASPVNLAGHYRLDTWGCGTGCLSGAVVDVLDGHVTFIPFSTCCSARLGEPNFQSVEFRSDSSLVIFHGKLNEVGEDGAHYYAFSQSGFRFIRAISDTPPAPVAVAPPSQPRPVAQEAPLSTIDCLLFYGSNACGNGDRSAANTVKPEPPVKSAAPAPAPRADFGAKDIELMHVTYEANQARFEAVYVGKSFFANMVVSGVKKDLFDASTNVVTTGTSFHGLDCRVSDAVGRAKSIALNPGDHLNIAGTVKDHVVGSVIIDPCEISIP